VADAGDDRDRSISSAAAPRRRRERDGHRPLRQPPSRRRATVGRKTTVRDDRQRRHLRVTSRRCVHLAGIFSPDHRVPGPARNRTTRQVRRRRAPRTGSAQRGGEAGLHQGEVGTRKKVRDSPRAAGRATPRQLAGRPGRRRCPSRPPSALGSRARGRRARGIGHRPREVERLAAEARARSRPRISEWRQRRRERDRPSTTRPEAAARADDEVRDSADGSRSRSSLTTMAPRVNEGLSSKRLCARSPSLPRWPMAVTRRASAGPQGICALQKAGSSGHRSLSANRRQHDRHGHVARSTAPAHRPRHEPSRTRGRPLAPFARRPTANRPRRTGRSPWAIPRRRHGGDH
jgi:hypothetical protein